MLPVRPMSSQVSRACPQRRAGLWPVFCVLLLVFLQSCAAAPQSAALRREAPAQFAAPFVLSDIAFFPQELYQCGPAALATMLTASGLATSPEALVPLVYMPERKGALQVELVAATRSVGRLAYELSPSLDALFAEVRAGNPVLVLQNLAVSWYPKWHFAVLKGYDLERRKMILNSGVHEDYEVSMRAFENTWARSQYWAMVVVAPGIVPQTAEPVAYYNALVTLEPRHSSEHIAPAYVSGLQRWPQDRGLLMGYGNLLYAAAAQREAAALFATVIAAYPDYAPAYNNLAQIQWEAGDLVAAEGNARKAVALGGNYLATYLETLSGIAAAQP